MIEHLHQIIMASLAVTFIAGIAKTELGKLCREVEDSLTGIGHPSAFRGITHNFKL